MHFKLPWIVISRPCDVICFDVLAFSSMAVPFSTLSSISRAASGHSASAAAFASAVALALAAAASALRISLECGEWPGTSTNKKGQRSACDHRVSEAGARQACTRRYTRPYSNYNLLVRVQTSQKKHQKNKQQRVQHKVGESEGEKADKMEMIAGGAWRWVPWHTPSLTASYSNGVRMLAHRAVSLFTRFRRRATLAVAV